MKIEELTLKGIIDLAAKIDAVNQQKSTEYLLEQQGSTSPIKHIPADTSASIQAPKYIGMDLYARYFGRYVICRSRSEGVNAGEVVAADATGVILKDARRLYYHKPVDKNMSWYEGVALTGLSQDSLVGPAVEKIIVEDYSLTVCSQVAAQSIKSAPTNKQS